MKNERIEYVVSHQKSMKNTYIGHNSIVIYVIVDRTLLFFSLLFVARSGHGVQCYITCDHFSSVGIKFYDTHNILSHSVWSLLIAVRSSR